MATDDAFAQYLADHPNDASASAYIDQYLLSLNLSSLTPFIHGLFIDGEKNPDVLQQKIYATPEFKQEFPEIAQRAAAGKTALSPGDIINARHGYQTALSAVGINPDFLTKEQQTQMIVNDKSPDELRQQLVNTYQKLQSDPTIAPQLQRLYGMGATPGEIAAFFLDPDHTQAYLEQREASGAIAARAQSAGFGQLDKTQAEHLASLGITDAQATSGFGNLAQQKALLDPLASENGAISADTAISAQFDNNADAQNRLKKRLQNRQADFAGGGNFTDPNKSGLTGAGTSNA